MTSVILFSIIVACEVGFWVLLLGGLACRYMFGFAKLSTALLISVPLVDFMLLAATTLDLAQGNTATFAHGLAAAYIGFSVAFGRSTIEWADKWFAHRYVGGEAVSSAPTHGWPLIRYELKWWLRCVLAVLVTQLLVASAILLVADAARTEALEPWLTLPWITVTLWFVFGPLWVAVFNRTPA